LLVNNHGVPETLERRQTWANNVLDWENSEDNTNEVFLTDSKLGAYVSRMVRVFKCPTDRMPAPNGPRTRTMSMNAMVGNPGALTNRFNPKYVQFYKIVQMPGPSLTFVFVDELADTLNDGFFVNNLDEFSWGNVPILPQRCCELLICGRPSGAASLAGPFDGSGCARATHLRF
jgi:hypothetical protein